MNDQLQQAPGRWNRAQQHTQPSSGFQWTFLRSSSRQSWHHLRQSPTFRGLVQPSLGLKKKNKIKIKSRF